MAENIDINPTHLKIVTDILHKILPQDVTVWVFGSRAKWTAKEFSDLDLALEGKNGAKIPTDIIARLDDDFEESDLPWKVDVVDINAVASSFKEIIMKGRVKLEGWENRSNKTLRNRSIISEWPRVPVSEVCSVIVDCVNRTAPKVPYDTPYKMIRTPNIRGGKLNLENCFFVDEPTYKRWTRRAKVLEGDVLLTREAPLGEVGYVNCNEKVFLGQRIMQYRADPEKMNPRFLLYTFLSKDLQHQFRTHEGSGSVVSHIRVGDCHKFEVNVPPIAMQTKIAYFLGGIDDKIELNQRMNKTLEEMAQAIFKCWFVDFEPTRAKIAQKEGSGESDADICTRLKITPEILSLFPATLTNSELGKIPDGWGIKLSGDEIDVRDGTHASPKKSDTGYPLITSKHIKDGQIDFSSAYLISATDYAEVNRRSAVKTGDILLTMIGTVGNSLLVMQEDINFAIKNVCLFRTSASQYIKNYFYLLLQSHNMQSYLEARMAGSTQKYLSLTVLRSIEMIVPSMELLNAFDDIIDPLFKKIYIEHEQSQLLSQTRDALLPKLLSGEISVVEAGHIMEAL